MPVHPISGGSVDSVQLTSTNSSVSITPTGAQDGTVSINLEAVGASGAVNSVAITSANANALITPSGPQVGATAFTVAVQDPPVQSVELTSLNSNLVITPAGPQTGVASFNLTVAGGSGSGTVTSVGVSSSTLTLSGTNPVTSSGTIGVNLPTTAVTPGSYTNINGTVDAYGRFTAVSNGTSSGAVDSVEFTNTDGTLAIIPAGAQTGAVSISLNSAPLQVAPNGTSSYTIQASDSNKSLQFYYNGGDITVTVPGNIGLISFGVQALSRITGAITFVAGTGLTNFIVLDEVSTFKLSPGQNATCNLYSFDPGTVYCKVTISAPVLQTEGTQNDIQGLLNLEAGTGISLSNDAAGTTTITATGGGAPTTATYVLNTANGDLTDAQVLADLATGLVKVTTTTGVLSTAEATDIFSTGRFNPSTEEFLNINSNQVLTVDDPQNIYVTTSGGSAGFTMPDQTLAGALLGSYSFTNAGSNTIFVNDHSNTLICSIMVGETWTVFNTDYTVSAGVWLAYRNGGEVPDFTGIAYNTAGLLTKANASQVIGSTTLVPYSDINFVSSGDIALANYSAQTLTVGNASTGGNLIMPDPSMPGPLLQGSSYTITVASSDGTNFFYPITLKNSNGTAVLNLADEVTPVVMNPGETWIVWYRPLNSSCVAYNISSANNVVLQGSYLSTNGATFDTYEGSFSSTIVRGPQGASVIYTYPGLVTSLDDVTSFVFKTSGGSLFPTTSFPANGSTSIPVFSNGSPTMGFITVNATASGGQVRVDATSGGFNFATGTAVILPGMVSFPL